MKTASWENNIIHFDQRRNLLIADSKNAAVELAVEHFVSLADRAIGKKGSFNVALSGGSTPKALFQRLASPEHAARVEWSLVNLFWSDERSVGPEDADSNYRMAMNAGLKDLPIPREHIYRMEAEDHIDANAKKYTNTIQKVVSNTELDLVTLGMGSDGHVASLFPGTHALQSRELVTANYIPHMNTWRMTFTFTCINRAENICLYVLGKDKAEMVHRVFTQSYMPDKLPAQRVGTSAKKALWILDHDAASVLRDEGVI